MLAAYDDKTAYAQCIFSLSLSSRSEPLVFVGRTPGKVSHCWRGAEGGRSREIMGAILLIPLKV